MLKAVMGRKSSSAQGRAADFHINARNKQKRDPLDVSPFLFGGPRESKLAPEGSYHTVDCHYQKIAIINIVVAFISGRAHSARQRCSSKSSCSG